MALVDLIKVGYANVAGTRKPLTQYVEGTMQGFVDSSPVNIWEFSHLITTKPTPGNPSTWDWTPAIQAALNSVAIGALDPANSGGCVFIPPLKDGGTPYNRGFYRVTELEVPEGVCIMAYGATISPFDQSEIHPHLISFAGTSKIAGLQIAMDYSTTYACAIKCGRDGTGNGGGRNVDFNQVAVWFAANAVTIGDPSWLLNPNKGWYGTSEVEFSGCQFNWCLRTATVYGLNSIVYFTGGTRCYANRGSIPTAHPNRTNWLAAPMGNFLNYGGLVQISGAPVGTFSRDVPSFTSRVMPVTHQDYLNSYGRFYVSGTYIETSFLFFAPGESGSNIAQDVSTKALIMTNCNGHLATSPADNHWIAASSQMQQGVDIRACGFYGTQGVTPTRTKLISVSGAPVHATADNWRSVLASGTEFKDANVVNYPVDLPNLNLVTAFGSAQAVSTSSSTLLMPNIGIIDLYSGARGLYYNSSTGLFTAAVDLSNIELAVDLRYASPSSLNQVTMDLVVSGVTMDTVVLIGAYPRGIFRIRRIAKGSTFLLRMVGSAAYTLDGTASTKLTLVSTV